MTPPAGRIPQCFSQRLALVELGGPEYRIEGWRKTRRIVLLWRIAFLSLIRRSRGRTGYGPFRQCFSWFRVAGRPNCLFRTRFGSLRSAPQILGIPSL